MRLELCTNEGEYVCSLHDRRGRFEDYDTGLMIPGGNISIIMHYKVPQGSLYPTVVFRSPPYLDQPIIHTLWLHNGQS